MAKKPNPSPPPEDDQARIFRWLEIVGLIFTVAFTGVIAFIGQEQFKAFIADSRPWIGLYDNGEAAPSNNAMFHASVSNVGKRPARITEIRCNVNYGIGASHPSDGDTDTDLTNQPISGQSSIIILVPGQATGCSHVLEFTTVSNAVSNVATAIRSGGITVYYFTRVKYDDIETGYHYVTKTCIYWNRIDKRWSFCSFYNDAT